MSEATVARRGERLIGGGLGVGLAGVLLCGVGLVTRPRDAFFSYLAAFAYGLSLALGALILVMIGHVTAARWFVVLRRLAESIAATLPAFALLFLPLLLGLQELYPWVPPLEGVEPAVREKILKKGAYLNVPAFLLRAALYFTVWTLLAELLRRWSARQDLEPSPELVRRQRALSAGGLVAVALTLSFAAFDWLMALSPEWYSTIFGVYYFAGGFLGALALLAVVAFGSERAGLLSGLVATAHYQVLGKLLLTFVIFWAYIAFSQLLVIWIGNIPVEVSWYLPRTRGSWSALGAGLIAGHFALPFLLLLSREAKTRPAVLAGIGAWLLLMHYLDLYWLVFPARDPGGVRPHWLDLAALAAVLGLALAYGAWQFRGRAPVPVGDPDLEASLRYRGP